MRKRLTHPLDGAVARINRAGKHVAELKRRAQRFAMAYHNSIIIKSRPEIPGFLDFRPQSPFPIPESISIVVGEISYNLRAALDYLIYELARFDSRRIQEGTQFPIEYRKKQFDKIAPRWLAGLNPGHVAMIEARQPYRGCDWIATLKEISNPDKHRKLTGSGYGGAVWTERIGEVRPVFDPGAAGAQIRTVHRTHGPGGTEMHVQLVSALPIQIWIKNEPVPVVETLQVLQSQVTDTIEAFKPEFQRD